MIRVGINERRFATRALACGERVRYLINDFPKIVDKIPDDRGWNRGKPGVVEMLESLFALADYRLSLSTLRFEGGDLYCRLLH